MQLVYSTAPVDCNALHFYLPYQNLILPHGSTWTTLSTQLTKQYTCITKDNYASQKCITEKNLVLNMAVLLHPTFTPNNSLSDYHFLDFCSISLIGNRTIIKELKKDFMLKILKMCLLDGIISSKMKIELT